MKKSRLQSPKKIDWQGLESTERKKVEKPKVAWGGIEDDNTWRG